MVNDVMHLFFYVASFVLARLAWSTVRALLGYRKGLG